MLETMPMPSEVLANVENQIIEQYMQALKEVVKKDIRIDSNTEGYLREDMRQAVGSYQPIFK